MTKEKEITVLQECIAMFPEDSYIAPWLKEVQLEVERSIQNDFIPSASIIKTLADCDTMLTEATAKANKLIEEATNKANKIIKDAEATKVRITNSVYDALAKSMHLIQDI